MRRSVFFFKQKTAYEMRISDWSSDVCSSDLYWLAGPLSLAAAAAGLFVVGLWAARSYERMAAIKDPGAIVIDEVVGQWLTLVPAALEPWAPNPWTVSLAFCLFRLRSDARRGGQAG